MLAETRPAVRGRPINQAIDDFSHLPADGESIFYGGFNRALLIASVGGESREPTFDVTRPTGPGPAGLLGNAYTFALTDTNNLISSTTEAQITACAEYVIDLLSRYVEWRGTLDFVVDIKPDSQSPYPEADGILPSVAQIAWNGSGWDNQTLMEALTGVDSNTNAFDAGCTMYLAADGTIRNYGMPVWFDPNPQFNVDPGVPTGMPDFIGIYTHEIFHSLGFYQITDQWQDMITTNGGISYFTGSNVVALYGGPVPFLSNSDHYGNTGGSGDIISRGLMYAFGNYELNRLDIGRIDLAILKDLGHSIRTYDGLSLFEFIDNSPNLAGTSGNDVLYGDYHSNSLRGGGGNDVLIGGAGADFLDGWIGDDTYWIEDSTDTISEFAGDGNDIIKASTSYVLADDISVETMATLDLAGTEEIDLTGNNLDNIIIGNAGVNQLAGGLGNDLLIGGAGADQMNGGHGDDTYYVDTALDIVTEAASNGFDVIFSSVGYALGAGVHVELLSAIDSAATDAINFVGNELANILYGNAGVNVLVGGGGGDTLNGLAGDDVYYIYDAQSVANEAANAGFDVLYSTVSYTLIAGVSVELISAIDSAATDGINFVGNELANILYGNAGVNVLVGGGGADILNGLAGDDVYYIYDADAQVFEAAGNGTDLVFASVSYSLRADTAVEFLGAVVGTGYAIDLTGNDLANIVQGNAGANVIDGGLGNDTLIGQGGTDTFAFTTALGGGNVDTISDFSAADDTIRLDDAIFAGLAPGALNANAFVIGSAAQDADDRIVYNSATGQLFYDADGNGAGAAILFATVTAGTALTASDFQVI